MKRFKYTIFGLLFSFFSLIVLVYAQQADTNSISLFGSTRPDNERLVPNCSYRDEYNPYTKQTTRNEVCHPYLMPVSANTSSGVGGGSVGGGNWLNPNTNTYSNYSNYTTSNNPTIYYDYYIQEQQPSYLDKGYVNTTENYIYEIIDKVDWSGGSPYTNEDVNNYSYSTPGLTPWNSSGYANEDVYDYGNQSSRYLNEDVSYYGSELTSWNNTIGNGSGYMNEEIYVPSNSSSYINEDIYYYPSGGSDGVGYSNEDVSGYVSEDVYY